MGIEGSEMKITPEELAFLVKLKAELEDEDSEWDRKAQAFRRRNMPRLVERIKMLEGIIAKLSEGE